MPRGRRALLQRQVSDDEFETPAFREVEKKEGGGKYEEDDSDSEEELQFPENDDSDESPEDEDLEITEKRKDAVDTDDSDDAPEDVGFKESRKTALSEMRDVMNQMKEEKLQLKTKRKLKDEKFKEQKRMKMEALSRLSEDVISSLSEKMNEPKSMKTEEALKLHKKTGKKKREKKKEEAARKTDTMKQITVIEESEDYIPLDTGFVDSESGIKILSLKDMRKKTAVSQSAANFKNSRLYGDPRKRESTKAYLAKMERKRVNKQKT